MKSVLFMTNYPAPYRVQFFDELGKYCDLTVVFEEVAGIQKNRNTGWFINQSENFKAIYLCSKFYGALKICPDIVKILKKSYDKIFVGLYSTNTAILAIIYMNTKKIPFILSTDGGFISKEPFLKYKIKKYLVGSAKEWMSTGKFATDYLVHYGAKKEKIHFYSFTSLTEKDNKSICISSEIEKIDLRKKLGMKEKFIILCVGQFIYRKGIDLLIAAMEDMPEDVGLYILGDTPTDDYLQRVHRLKFANIHFPGFKKKSELDLYYKASDLFVLPTREDIWGLVICEAIVYGLPVVTTNKCGAGLEMIKNGYNGYLIESDNIKMLKSAIENIYYNPDICVYAHAYREEIKKEYSIEKMVMQHINIIEQD